MALMGLVFNFVGNAFKKNGRRFIVGVLGNEFAGEGAGEKGGRELVHLAARFGQPQLKLVGQRKQSLHSPHDFLLLGEGWQRHGKASKVRDGNVRDSSSHRFGLDKVLGEPALNNTKKKWFVGSQATKANNCHRLADAERFICLNQCSATANRAVLRNENLVPPWLVLFR